MFFHFTFFFYLFPFSFVTLSNLQIETHKNQTLHHLLNQNPNFQNVQRSSASISSISGCLFCAFELLTGNEIFYRDWVNF